MSNREEKLFKEFPPVSEKQWKDQVIKDLKGKEFEKLIWKTSENLEVEPFYTENSLKPIEYLLKNPPGEFPYTRGSTSRNNDWELNQEITSSDINLANKYALASLNGGANSLTLNCEMKGGVCFGIPIQNRDDTSLLLNDIDLEKFPIHLKCGHGSIAILSLLINEARERGVKLDMLSGSMDTDPLMDLTKLGSFPKGEKNSFEELRALISYLKKNMPNYKGLKVHSTYFHESGASITQELAFTLAAGVEYLDQLTDMDLTVDQILQQTSFSFSIGSNYFMEIAKLRAARLLWAKIIEQYSPKEETSAVMHIEAQTSTNNKTVYDPYVNLLRGTVETMAGALGGANIISVLPFDSEYNPPDEFSLRMARNTQLLLKNETYLDRIVDPSAGSYYIENLTNSIAQESWKIFQRIEENGGFVESLKTGTIQSEIEKNRKARETNITSRRETVLGVNQYPNLEETASDRIKMSVSQIEIKKSSNSIDTLDKLSIEFSSDYLKDNKVYAGDLIFESIEEQKLNISTLKSFRIAENFEELRLSTERYFKETRKTPKVFLLTIGNPSMRSARASFSSNFFGCAGFEIINNIGFDTPEQAIESALENNSDIVVICSSDNEYIDHSPEIIKGIKQDNPGIQVIIAGNPKEHIEELKKAGADDFIHIKTNAYETLKKYQKVLGINN